MTLRGIPSHAKSWKRKHLPADMQGSGTIMTKVPHGSKRGMARQGMESWGQPTPNILAQATPGAWHSRNAHLR